MNKLYVVGIGPGKWEELTGEAIKALQESQVIVGYTLYVDLIKDYFKEKEFLCTPMTKERERCLAGFSEAEAGKTTALVCSGDAGVYGLAGLILELGAKYPTVVVEIIPGVTAALSGGALLGAPLGHDFAVISLSDLLTPWEKIEKRLRLAAEADFAICLYNPSSMKRRDYLKKACRLILESARPDTPCGMVRNIGREGQQIEQMTLAQLTDWDTDMFTTVFIGNSQTLRIGNYMVTPRGYTR